MAAGYHTVITVGTFLMGGAFGERYPTDGEAPDQSSTSTRSASTSDGSGCPPALTFDALVSRGVSL